MIAILILGKETSELAANFLQWSRLVLVFLLRFHSPLQTKQTAEVFVLSHLKPCLELSLLPHVKLMPSCSLVTVVHFYVWVW